MLHHELHSRRAGARILLAAAAVFAVHAQTTTDPSLKFDVASVKVNRSGIRGMGSNILPGGHYKADNVPLQWLLADAFEVPFQGNRMAGIPDWAGSVRYDIEAKAPANAFPPQATSSERHHIMRTMLQNLLKERFHLEIHSESKEMPVYALVVAKGGPKLLPAKIEEKDCLAAPPRGMVACHNFNGGMGRGLHASAATVGDMLSFVENWTDRPLVDKSGVSGLYAFETEGWVPILPRSPDAPDEGVSDPARPTIFMLMARMGLKLESQKAPIERWVIDRMERPSEN